MCVRYRCRSQAFLPDASVAHQASPFFCPPTPNLFPASALPVIISDALLLPPCKSRWECQWTHLASSSSSVLWMASVSYLVLHWATSELALDRTRCSSALASVSSSYCSRSRSQSCRADCSAWARAFLAWEEVGTKEVGQLFS